eukprot:TRINITY_DN5029_c0_g2_i2.p2 TRINITY_DN5029_c0_g2~~TRINITY_DN5029_c0_g2_i2.p2  ORF type:complete len:471 (-),score=146.41 TRINITY_DN5029_c0_g2_i2:236-1648(-)
MDDLCKKLHGFASQCQNIVDNYLITIIESVVAKETPDVACQQVHMCNASTVAPVVVKKTTVVASGVECAACEWLFTEAEKELSNNSTEAEIEKALDAICNKMKGGLAGTCTDLVNAYFPEIVAVIVQKVSPDGICKKLGVCDSTVMPHTTPLGPEKHQKTTPIGPEKHQKTTPIGPEKQGETASVKCVICEWVLNKLEGMLSSNSTEQEIIAALDKVCSLLPHSVQSDCEDLINQYGPQLIQLLLQHEPADTICSQIGLCKNSSATVDMKTVTPAPLVKDVKSGAYCAICEFIMDKLETLISNNSTEQEIIAAVEKVCGFLPKTIRSECDSLVETYGQQIINMLLQKENPQTICTQLGLCKSTAVVEQVQNGELCVLCEFVMSKLEGLLQNNASETKILNALEKVCSYLPKSLSGECDAFIQQYGPQIFQLIVQKEPPKTICTQLGICSGTSKNLLGGLRGGRRHKHHYM